MCDSLAFTKNQKFIPGLSFIVVIKDKTNYLIKCVCSSIFDFGFKNGSKLKIESNNKTESRDF